MTAPQSKEHQLTVYNAINMYFSLPQQVYDFIPISKMEKFQLEDKGNKTVDVCGIIQSADIDYTILQSKTTGKEMFKVCNHFNENINDRYC